MTDDRKPHPLGGMEWNNCPKCDYYYKQSILAECPLCRHKWRNPVSYQQPTWESPGL